MFIHIEISRPFVAKPWFIKKQLGTVRFGWLWLAVGYFPMRFDELVEGVSDGMYKWGGL